MTRSNNITWIVLVILTITSFILARGNAGSLLWLIVALAGVKFSLVAWKFMEMRDAAIVWSLGVFGALGIILAMTIFLR